MGGILTYPPFFQTNSFVETFCNRKLGRGFGRLPMRAGVKGLASRGACKSRRKTETIVSTNHQRASRNPILKTLSSSSDIHTSPTLVGQSNISDFDN